MLYDLTDPLGRERFKRRCNQLYREQGVVELTKRKERRTLSQNAYLHLLLGWYAMETGNRLEYVKREYFKVLCNPEIFVSEVQDRYRGEITIVKSSREVSTAEMTTAIERFRNWSSSECGIYLPSPDERDFLRSIEIEMKRQEAYL